MSVQRIQIRSEGKYSHAAVWPLFLGYELSNGKRHYSLTAMVANLAKPTPERPAPMRHDDVTTWLVDMDYTKLWNGLREKISYDAGYYKYTYSLQTCTPPFKKASSDPGLGKLYRDKVLHVGRSRDDMDSLKDFVGRKPNPKAFIHEIEGQDGEVKKGASF